MTYSDRQLVNSAFDITAARLLFERAYAFVLQAAGQGLDPATLSIYNDSLAVFQSHFMEWSASLSRAQVRASIPLLDLLLPPDSKTRPMAEGRFLSPTVKVGRSVVPPSTEDPSGPATLPPVISTVAVLALQQYLLAKGNNDTTSEALF